jgi:predicted ATP-dependent serine protease
MAEILELPRGRHNQPGYFSLANLPQRGSVATQAYGAGWEELDRIFKFYRGQFVVVTGVAGQGKSTFLLNMLTKIAREKGVRSFLYVPENEAHLHEKLQKIWGADEESFQLSARANASSSPLFPPPTTIHRTRSTGCSTKPLWQSKRIASRWS